MNPSFTVIEPLRHDGQDYAPGATVTLGPGPAGILLAAGVVEALEVDGDPGELDLPALGDMTKAQLVGYAKSTYNVELDPGDTKATLLQAIHDLEATS